MYDINNVHILVYVIFGMVGILVGKLVAWMNLRLPEEQKIFSKDFFAENKKGVPGSYICMILMAVLYTLLLRRFGIGDTFLQNLDLIKFIILMPMLLSSFMIDLKHRILPNRLNLTIFECGLMFAFIYGIHNINLAKDMLLGMLAGAGIFGAITVLRRIDCWKRGNGTWGCEIYGSHWLIFWSQCYCSNLTFGVFCGSDYISVSAICKSVYFKK